MKTDTEIKPGEPAWLGVLINHVRSLHFGTVQVVVHDSRVVQIEKTEKVRFEKPDLNLLTLQAKGSHGTESFP